MIDWLVRVLSVVPAELATVVLATLPIGELRGALPIALLVYRLPLPLAISLSILGNMLPIYFVLIFFERVSVYLSKRSETAARFFDWLFERTRHKLHDKVERYGYWALTLFVAVPLPVTGAWTGALAAFVFGLPKGKSFGAILLGVCISATIVTMLALGGLAAGRSLFLN